MKKSQIAGILFGAAMGAWNKVNAPEQLFIEEDYMQ